MMTLAIINPPKLLKNVGFGNKKAPKKGLVV
jgi:hypothetical protein